MTSDRPVLAHGGADSTVFGELRKLLHTAESFDETRTRELLEQLDDPLDLEAVGAMLRSPRASRLLNRQEGLMETRIALLGSSTLDSLPNLLTATAVRRGILPEIRTAGFNQWQLEVMAGAPSLADFQPRLTACLLDDTAVLDGVTDATDVAELTDRCAQFTATVEAWLSQCRATVGGLIVLTTIGLTPLRWRRLRSFAARAAFESAWLRMNADIAAMASRDTVVLSGWSLSSSVDATFAADRMRHLASHAYAPEFLAAYAEELVRVAAADLGRASKCLVLDLDDTLWGGVVGECGTAGLRLAGGYPGAAHTELQELARDLSRQGVLLTLCSKNEEAVAQRALAEHPEMVLRPDAFAATRINWDSKPGNVQAIADELNLGLDAMVFVDDNPAERDQMRLFAPQVRTVPLPADPAGYARVLAGRDDFAVLSVTDDDRGRTAQYRAEAARRELVRTSASFDEYLTSLASRLTVEPLAPFNADRIQQLFAKTNQFNLTGIRYGVDEIADALTAATDPPEGAPQAGESMRRFYGAKLVDRYGDHGLIAALGIVVTPGRSWEIENFVLSCRVFGRSVEDALVALILRGAADQGVSLVQASFQATARNQRFADFYLRVGFSEATSGRYRHDLATLPEPPEWIDVSDNQEVFRVG